MGDDAHIAKYSWLRFCKNPLKMNNWHMMNNAAYIRGRDFAIFLAPPSDNSILKDRDAFFFPTATAVAEFSFTHGGHAAAAGRHNIRETKSSGFHLRKKHGAFY